MSDHLVLTRADGVLEVQLNRPEKKNALTRDMYHGMTAAFEASNDDPTVRVIILTGTGDTFTSGNDVKDFLARANGGGEGAGERFLPALSRMTKPMIGAVNGAAIGVGTTMLLHCDLIVAAAGASFRMPFTSLGLVPEAGSSMLVPQAIGMRRANAMLLLGEAIDAETALAWGLINQVVDASALHDTAWSLARRLAALPPEAVRQTKALIQHGKPDLADRMHEELDVLGRRFTTPEAKEAFSAFIEKRRPDFSKLY